MQDSPIRVPVETPSRSYDVLIGEGLIDQVGEKCADILRPTRCAVITDSTVGPLYAKRVERSLTAAGFEPFRQVVPAGEASKSLAQTELLLESLSTQGMDRGAFVVALGGGVVGDLAGFVAGLHMRGIPFVQIPTTIVAQVDSAVGGKTGVNLKAGKNLVGVFHQPGLVLVDPCLLNTLPDREYYEGFAEVVKHAAIRDPALFERLKTFHRSDSISDILATNVAIKAGIVRADETERSGLRALLNFGHTLGHAIEQAAGYGAYLNGEAISIGMVAAASLSVRLAGFDPSQAEQLTALLEHFQLPIHLKTPLAEEKLLEAMSRDKKFVGGAVRFVLLRAIGDAFLSDGVTLDHLREAIREMNP